ncbi:MAG TPA: hypothetical protein VN366_00270 [Feifaniaceae bacterium]|nr:hypothetical protein [Feifaniaceae bacterium]
MAFEGIGSKIMIHKVTDFSKEASNLQKSGEMAQAHIQSRAMHDAELARQQVVDVYEPSDVAIQREKEREKRQQEQKREEKKQEAHKKPLPGEPTKIDIEI